MDWTLATTLLVLVQSALIAALLLARLRLRRAALEARKVAEEFTRMVRLTVLAELSTSVSSQLAQPATAMLINIETAVATLHSSKQDPLLLREILDDLHTDCDRLANILHQLRDRPMQERTAIQPVDLNAALGNVLELIRVAARTHGIEVQTAFAARLPLIEADSIQVLGVFMNLCMNSIDAMRYATREPRVLTISTSVSGSVVIVSVRDNAPGVAAKRVPLLIAERIVESHGGRLWMNPDAEGTTCGLAIPVLVKE